MSGTATTAGVLLTFSILPTTADAQDASGSERRTAQNNQTSIIELDTVNVENEAIAAGNTNAAPLGIARLPATVQEMPQTVNVVTPELIQQQQITTLAEALRNVPGITMSTGEGNGGQNGDMFRIRGIEARGDIYVDGLRDFGNYTRDMFSIESVEVIKGPNGEAFGVGNLGGLINQTSRRAHLGNETNIDQQIGSGLLLRTTIDSNIQIDNTTALRIDGVFNDQDVADRDHTEANRTGLAADLGFGLGTDTVWHLNYMYLHGDRTPDYGVPMLMGRDGILRPLTEYAVSGVDRTTSYTRSYNHDITDVHVATSNFSKEINSWLTFNNDTRLTVYNRDFNATNPAACITTCATAILGGQNYALAYGAGGGMAYGQTGYGFQNVASGKAEFELGGFKNKAVFGLDTIYQQDQRHQMTAVNRVNNQTIINPQYEYPSTWFYYNPLNTRLSNATDIGVFASDRFWFNEKWSIQGGLRWDYFNSEFDNVAAAIGGSSTSRELSPSLSLIFEPTREYTYYASFSRAYRPIGTDIGLAVGGVATEVPRDGYDTEPERSDLYELGVKANFLGGRLGATAAIFRINKANSFTTDPVSGDVTAGFSDSGQSLRINGVELGLSGKVTDQWSVNIAYSYLDGEITYSPTVSQVGNVAQGIPPNNFAFWTSYDLGQLVSNNTDLLIGGGVKYASAYWSDADNTARIPETFSLDAMISLETRDKKYRLALNAYNLTDHLNYTSSFSAVRAVPASGRTVLLSMGTTF
ncbi:TonB-dependent siderophore receptor [Xanthobacter oligotrophicus]|uniref:TonB-dependent siderophore receptor n=1 Tax=Xanthobacter oligotrophicus TaxID=2607286 RepID=A0ABW7A227_9HYPH